MKHVWKRTLAAALCLALLAGFVLIATPEAKAGHYTGYTEVTQIANQGDCPSMQGCCSDETYIYCSKINTSTETSAVIARIHRTTGAVTWLTNSATGTKYFSQLSHANDLDIATISGVKTLFVATGGAGSGDYSLVRFALSGTTLTQIGHYNVTYNGSSTYLASAQVMSVEGDNVNLICKRGKYIFTATVGVNQTSGDVALTLLCTLDLADVTVNGSSMDISGYTQQGFEYYDGRIYVPMTEPNNMISNALVAYDVVGVSGTVKNNPIFSAILTSSTYVDLFEVESLTICPSDGRMYFNTNGRKTSSDANHDRIYYLTSFTYDAAAGDSTQPGNYRWDVANDKLCSVTTDGAQYNHAQIIQGTISSGVISDAYYSLDQAVVLKHSEPWIIEWKGSAVTSNSLLMSNQAKSGYEGNLYLYTRKDGLVSFGTYSSSAYNNYGINITTDHGLSTSAEHVYRLTNRVNSDGTNMVYLSVDGTELGAMNNYYVGGTSQGSTSDWLNGKDIEFNYLGTAQHLLNNTMSYIRVWGEGIPGQVDEPNNYRWETKRNALTNIEDFSLTSNAATTLYGSCTSGVYGGYQAKLSQNVVLLHNRPWTLEWHSSSWGEGGLLLAAAPTSRTYEAPYLFRSGIVSLGSWDGTRFNNYGVNLADHGIDGTTSHTFSLTNRIAADGSNMVYLSVDGKELGAMNNYYVGTTSQGTTSNWVSGRDFTFSYFGTYQHSVNGAISYFQAWENGKPTDHSPAKYRWEPGSSGLTSVTTSGYTENAASIMAGSCDTTAFTDSWFRLDDPIVLLHDRTWSIQWESEGSWRGTTNGAMLLSASQLKNELNAPYLYRRGNSEIIGFGARGDGNHYNYGIKLSDHGIDGTARHTYLLQNRVNTDGSNMVYLSVDGVELGAMNNYFVGGTAQGTIDNWVSGKDFVFYYLGTPQFPIDTCSISYLQVDGSCEHVYSDWSVTAATCITNGSRTRSCTLCGLTQTETIAATGHSYTRVVTAPTCTAGGYTTYTCTGCGNSYQSDATAATGHSYKTTVTAATCTTSGYTTYTCTICGYNYKGSYTAAAGHSYKSVVTAPTCTASGYTTFTCTGCGYSYQDAVTDPTAHSYSGGTCTVCGAKDPNYVAPPTISLKYPTVSFEDEIVMNVYFTAGSLENVMELGLITYSEKVSAWNVKNAEHVIPGYTYNTATGYLGVKTQGIPAKCLGDVIYFSVYAQLTDGSYIYSSLIGYNPKTYAYNQLSTGSAQMKALVVAMLNYGAAAQTYFGYKTDTLVNADLTATQKALVSDYSSSMMAAVTQPSGTKLGTMVNNGGYTRRYPTISFEGAFCVNYYFAPSAAPVGNVTMYVWNYADYTAASSLNKTNATQAITMELTDSGEYLAVVDGIAAKDLDKGIYVSFCYSDGTTEYCSGVIGYSIGVYCNTQAVKTGTLASLAAATAVYGYYAKEVFYSAG